MITKGLRNLSGDLPQNVLRGMTPFRYPGSTSIGNNVVISNEYNGSDGEAFWRAGGDVAVTLIGPGVDASHNYERTHIDALVATTNWISAYLITA